MEKFLNQFEIDALIKAINNNELSEWLHLHSISENASGRYPCTAVYEIEDYDLFYCSYELEKLTVCTSILRRYAYRDTKSFKNFKYFMVLEDYRNKSINIVSVVGIFVNSSNKLTYDYNYDRQNGVVYLVDASSLLFVYDYT